MKKITLILFLIVVCACKNEKSTGFSNDEILLDTAVTTVDSGGVVPIKAKVDSSKIKELKPLFKHKSDEFSEDKTEWITPLAAPKFRNRNGIYCYFSANNLRFVYQYHSDDWLFIKKCQFLVDGKTFEYFPGEVKRDNDESGITEWFDDSVDANNKDLIEALANAKKAKVKLNGDNYYDVKEISKKEIRSIKQTLEYFKALGNNI